MTMVDNLMVEARKDASGGSPNGTQTVKKNKKCTANSARNSAGRSVLYSPRFIIYDMDRFTPVHNGQYSQADLDHDRNTYEQTGNHSWSRNSRSSATREGYVHSELPTPPSLLTKRRDGAAFSVARHDFLETREN